MDTSDSRITFDENGVCDHCNDFYSKVLPNWHTDERGKIELLKIVEKIKSEGEGKDFVFWVLVEVSTVHICYILLLKNLDCDL
jgi:hypothetical protein